MKVLWGFWLLAALAGCQNYSRQNLASIQLVDRNDFEETISAKERLKQYERIDFLQPQPYKKVSRVFLKQKDGSLPAILTAYHDNGSMSHYLEIRNGRANGLYREFHKNGTLAIEAHVVEGFGELHAQAQSEWVFDGKSQAFDEEGALQACLYYQRGLIEGQACYFHKNGALAQRLMYHNGLLEGSVETFDDQGKVIELIRFEKGLKEGEAYRIDDKSNLVYKEQYRAGKLLQGVYYTQEGEVLSSVEEGQGIISVFTNGKLEKQCQVVDGEKEGKVWVYEEGKLQSLYSTHLSAKHGEEWLYYRDGQHKLMMEWYEDKVQGICRTWYLNGQLESEKEMHENEKHGLSVAWYTDGSLMLTEEYDKGVLQKGKYFAKGEDTPISSVVNGYGVATLFDKEGVYLKKVVYDKGCPE